MDEAVEVDRKRPLGLTRDTLVTFSRTAFGSGVLESVGMISTPESRGTTSTLTSSMVVASSITVGEMEERADSS